MSQAVARVESFENEAPLFPFPLVEKVTRSDAGLSASGRQWGSPRFARNAFDLSHKGSVRLPRRRLHQQGRDAACPAAHRHHPRPRLAAGADFRDVDAGLNEPRMGGVDVGDAPAQAAQPVLRRIRLLARPVRDLDNQVAAAEEHQPAPIGVRAVERHVEAEPRAIEGGGPLGVRRRDHDMVHRRDRSGRGSHRQRPLLVALEEEQADAARGLRGRSRALPRQRRT